jgi:hypothetical protein
MSVFESQFEAWIDSLRLIKRYQKLFITSCAKSGTTWLVKSLNGHSQIVAEGEGRFAWRLYSLLDQASNQFNQDQRSVGGSPLGVINGADYYTMIRSMTDNVFLRYLGSSGKSPENVRVIADKTPQHIFCADTLRAIYPGCRFINIVRDPRDAATSALFHLAKTDPQPRDQYIESFITRSWRGSVEAALKVERAMGPAAFMNVRYEDLHQDASAVMRKCLSFLGVDASPQALENCRDAGSFERLSGGRRRGQADPNSFYRKGIVGDWVNHIDPDLARRCCAPIEPLMRHFGYEQAWMPMLANANAQQFERSLSA